MKEYLDKGELEILKKEIGKLINEDKIDLTEEDLRKISGGVKNVSAKLTSSVLAALTGTGFFINNTFAQSDLPENMPVLNRQNVKTNNIKNEDSKPKQKSEKSGNLKKVAASAASVGIPVGVFATILYKALHSEKNHPKIGVIGSRELCEQFINRLPGDKVQTGLKYSRSEISGIRVEVDITKLIKWTDVRIDPGHYTLDFDFINILPSDYNVETEDKSIIKFIEDHDFICPLVDLSGVDAQHVRDYVTQNVCPLAIFLHKVDLYKYTDFILANVINNDVQSDASRILANMEHTVLSNFIEKKTKKQYGDQTIGTMLFPENNCQDRERYFSHFLFAYNWYFTLKHTHSTGVRGEYIR